MGESEQDWQGLHPSRLIPGYPAGLPQSWPERRQPECEKKGRVAEPGAALTALTRLSKGSTGKTPTAFAFSPLGSPPALSQQRFMLRQPIEPHAPHFQKKILILSTRAQRTQGRLKAECFSLHTWPICFTQD